MACMAERMAFFEFSLKNGRTYKKVLKTKFVEDFILYNSTTIKIQFEANEARYFVKSDFREFSP